MTYYNPYRADTNYRPAPAPRTWGVSEKQVSFLRDLCAKRVVPPATLEFLASVSVGDNKSREMSQHIDTAKACPFKVASLPTPLFAQAPVTPMPSTPGPLVPIGLYFLDGEVYKVKASKGDPTGTRRYAYCFVTNGSTKGTYVYTRGAIYKLNMDHKLTREKAAEIGHATGVCCCCGRELSDPASVAAGIGPVCASRNF